MEVVMQQHLQAACAITERPKEEHQPTGRIIQGVTKQKKEDKDKIDILLDTDEATARIARFNDSKLVAFDYETNMKKPDSDEARIICCSISNGRETIAFPWTKTTRAAMKLLLKNPKVKKIASNAKFEERWTRKEFGHGVWGWETDTMIMGHVLDNRQGITGIEFQTFVRLGIGPWDAKVAAFMESDYSNRPNKLDQAELEDVLTYCGKDSLFEYRVAEHQRGELG